MTLQLDARQRAMLAEMGIRLFLPEVARDEPGAVPVVSGAQRTPTEAPAARVPAPSPAPAIAPPASARVPSPAHTPPRAGADASLLNVQPWGDAPAHEADWLLVEEAAGEDDGGAGDARPAAVAQLLANMLKAAGLEGGRVHVARLRRQPDAAAASSALAAQVQRLQPLVVLAMGRGAAQALLGSEEPLGRLRGRIHRAAGTAVVVTYPPAFLLRNPGEKAKAWADLCLAGEAAGAQAGSRRPDAR